MKIKIILITSLMLFIVISLSNNSFDNTFDQSAATASAIKNKISNTYTSSSMKEKDNPKNLETLGIVRYEPTRLIEGALIQLGHEGENEDFAIQTATGEFYDINPEELDIEQYHQREAILSVEVFDDRVIQILEEVSEEYDQAAYNFFYPTDEISGLQRALVLMCKFADVSNEPVEDGYFENLMNNESYPGMKHYWETVSYGNMTIEVEDSGWKSIPNGTDDSESLYSDHLYPCLDAHDNDYNYPDYSIIIVAFNAAGDRLGNTAWGGRLTLSLDNQIKDYGVTWISDRLFSHHLVMAHEIGHGFSMPHSGTNENNPYASDWDVMSDGRGSGNISVHPIAAHKKQVNWIKDDEVSTFYYDRDDELTVNLDYLSNDSGSGSKMIIIRHTNLNTDTRYITLESRSKDDSYYDGGIPGSGILMHEQHNDSRLYFTSSLYLVSANGSQSNGKTHGNAIHTAQDTYYDSDRNLLISLESDYSGGYEVKIRKGSTKINFDNMSDYQLISNITNQSVDISTENFSGNTTQIDLYANGNHIGTDTNSPYNFSWTDSSSTDIFELKAVATLDSGETESENIVLFKGSNHPQISINNSDFNLIYDTANRNISGTVSTNFPTPCHNLASQSFSFTNNQLEFNYSTEKDIVEVRCPLMISRREVFVNFDMRLRYDSLTNPQVDFRSSHQ